MESQLLTNNIFRQIESQEVGQRIRPVPAVGNLRRILEIDQETVGPRQQRQQNMQSQARVARGPTEIEEPRTQRQLPRRLQATPMTAVLRQDNAPLLPLVYPPNKYATIREVIRRGKEHERHSLAFAKPPPKWSSSNDANHWSSLKKIYARVDAKREQLNFDKTYENTLLAAEWLDNQERKSLSMSKYVIYLRQTYSNSRK